MKIGDYVWLSDGYMFSENNKRIGMIINIFEFSEERLYDIGFISDNVITYMRNKNSFIKMTDEEVFQLEMEK